MASEQIKSSIAPCGLSCEKCFAHLNGDIRRYSKKLKEELGNFAHHAERFGMLLDNPVFKNYPAFKEMLDYFASKNCKGCRNEQCKLFNACGVRVCHQEKRIDFCYACDEFPCDKTNFDPKMYKAWVYRNQSIKKDGLGKYYKSTLKQPRYI